MNRTEPITGRDALVLREQLVPGVEGALQGVTCDGTFVVVAGGNRLYRMRPGNDRVVDQLETGPSLGGLAFDGEHYWHLSGEHLERIDRRTGLVLWSIATDLTDVTGLACLENDVLVAHAGGREIVRIEPRYGTIVGELPVTGRIHGLALVCGQLWCATAFELRRIDPATGRVLASLALPSGTTVCDLAGDDDCRFWCVDGRTSRLRVFARPT